MNTSPKYFPALKPLKGPHRIEWFGQIYQGTATSIALVFSPWGTDPATGELRSNPAERSTLLMPAPFLNLFRIGDIWEDGRFTGQRDISTRETFHLDVREGSAKIMPAGAPLGEDSGPHAEYPLPFAVFGAHRDHTHAYCARIEIDPNTMLVIPCMELVRFYFGASGSFLKRLFSGAFALDKLFFRKRRGANSSVVNIDLADDLPGSAAATVARIAFDTQARNAAAWIVNSGTSASANKKRYYPKTTFPFYGETDLTVDGRWIEQNGRRVFLAEQIKCCTHPFPFDTLFYTTRKSPLNSKRDSASPKQDSGTAADESVTGNVEHQLEEGLVSSTLQPIGIPVEAEIDEPFPDLASKKIRRSKSDAERGYFRPSADIQPELATGRETTSVDTRAAEVMQEMEEDIFDEAFIEELPTQAVEAFKEAFGAFRSAGSRHYRLMPPIPIDPSDPMRPGPFVRGSDVCSGGGRQLDRVWCAVITSRDNPVGLTLVLVRDGDQEEYEDHLLLVGVDQTDKAISTIQRYCREFAEQRLSSQLMESILVSKHTHLATDIYSLLRGMSAGINWHGKVSKRPVSTLLDSLPKDMLEQPLIRMEALDRVPGKMGRK